ncbi:helix-turn-helix domain-containing protein [Nocardia terpenica]|uniref:Transcriptional regulator n=1 Tax=Nocardia terpenica TaxID=455432 RepID=A0A291RMA1_9NOCA|nr:helix-turn-helix transcriptional regulator [Nocardia terpenica]ATL68716.1 transcriptional regulator [Nocardia terpenica]
MTTVGERIAAERKLAGLKQIQLAQKASYSVSMVRAVEQGREPAAPGFIAAVARALRIEPELLTGVPYYETLEADGPLEGLAELGSILAEGADVRQVEPPALTELARDLSAINLDCRNDRGRAALLRLPVLIRQLYGAIDAAGDDAERGRVFSLLAHAYMQAEGLTHRFGFIALTMLALDRLEWAASYADNSLYVAQAKLERKKALLYYGSNEVGLRLVEQALDMVSGDNVAATEVRGFAHLSGAILAARDRRLDVARDHIAEARKLALLVNGESDLFGTNFGSANVEIHACAVELEAGDPGKAAREGSALVLPKDIAPPRAGHHWQDTARAWLLAGQPDKALHSLTLARRVAPQQTRLHPSVRETLHGIASAQRRQNDSLVSFASWARVAL